MKKTLTLVLIASLFASCEQKKEVATEAKVEYAKFGDSISDEAALSSEEMMKKFANLKEGDTIDVKFKSKINEVCQKKGCWMSVDLGNQMKHLLNLKIMAFLFP